jgi:hypothetical protein
MNVSKASSSKKGGWIRYAKKYCFCHNVAAIKVAMTVENPNRLFYRCKHEEPEKRCGYWQWCEPIGCETETTQQLDINMMDFDDELDGALVDQALKFDAMKKELEGKLAEMKKVMEEEIETVKNESEMEISKLKKMIEAQVQLVQEGNKEDVVEVKKHVEVEIYNFKKMVMEEMVSEKKSRYDEVSLLKGELGRSKSSLCKVKWVVVMMMVMVVWLGFLKN